MALGLSGRSQDPQRPAGIAGHARLTMTYNPSRATWLCSLPTASPEARHGARFHWWGGLVVAPVAESHGTLQGQSGILASRLDGRSTLAATWQVLRWALPKVIGASLGIGC